MHRTTAGEEQTLQQASQLSGGGQWSETLLVPQRQHSQDQLSHWFPSAPLSTASTQTSFCSTSQLSSAARDQYQAAKANDDRTREKEVDLLVATASDALVNEMVLNSGWRYSSKPRTSHQEIWKDQITESFNLACVTLNDRTVLSDELRRRIVQSISTIRSKMARAAENYVREYLQMSAESSTPEQAPADYIKMQELVAQITNPSIPDKFFLHKQGSNGIERIFGHPILEKFHLDFWYGCDTSPVMKFRTSYTTTPPYMLAFSGVALLCALHRVSRDRCSNSGNILKFSTVPYAQHFQHYYGAIINTLEDEYNGPRFRTQLNDLNAQGIEKIHSSGRAGVLLQPFVIPRAVMATSPGAGTSSDVPSLPPASHFDFDGGDYEFHPY